MRPAKDTVMQTLIQYHSKLFNNLQIESTGRLRSSSNISTVSSNHSLSIPTTTISSSTPIPNTATIPTTINTSLAPPPNVEVPIPSPVDSLYELYRDSVATTAAEETPSIPSVFTSVGNL